MRDAGTQKIVYVSLGSNMGDRLNNLRAAVRALRAIDGVKYTKVSPIYETSPVGYTDQPDFLNAAVELGVTSWDGAGFVRLLKRIESDLGRVPGPRWGPRSVDLDVVTFGEDRIQETGEMPVTIPHPRAAERVFVLIPIAALNEGAMIGDARVSELLEKAGVSSDEIPPGVKLWALPTGDERIWERI